MRYFAIGFKDWVEVRQGPAIPKAEKSVASGAYPKKEYIYDELRGYVLKESTKKITFKSVVYNGGKVLFTLRKDKFRNAIGYVVSKDAIAELPKEDAETLIEYAKKQGKY